MDPVPRVLGNDARLVQVFLNLLVNAAQALPEGHAADNRIVIRTRAADGRVRVEIEDSGAGIPGDLLARVGEPFFTTRREGLGLGVAVCKSILERVGGDLVIELGFEPALLSTFDLFNFTGGQSGTFSDIIFTDWGYNGVFNYATGVLTITSTPVPEPSTLALLGLGSVALAIKTRRRRRN